MDSVVAFVIAGGILWLSGFFFGCGHVSRKMRIKQEQRYLEQHKEYLDYLYRQEDGVSGN